MANEKHEEIAKGAGEIMEGIHLKKRDLWLVAGGALGALAALGLGRISGKMRPSAVSAVREGYAFKEWLAGKAEKVKEDMEDIVAEGVHQYQKDLSATAETVKREKDILERIEKMVEEKLSKIKPEQGEV
jgi:gas vesicle protein